MALVVTAATTTVIAAAGGATRAAGAAGAAGHDAPRDLDRARTIAECGLAAECHEQAADEDADRKEPLQHVLPADASTLETSHVPGE